jgi:hypothetical protein
MSVSSHTNGKRLQLVYVAESGGGAGSGERLRLLPTTGVERFLDAAAASGLDSETAVQLGVERFLVLIDASAYGLASSAARAHLNEAATRARAQLPLGPREAAELRRLNAARPLPSGRHRCELVVCLPERMLTRFHRYSASCRFDSEGVDEMLAWDIAARLEGRTMTEWALHVLAERQVA